MSQHDSVMVFADLHYWSTYNINAPNVGVTTFVPSV